MNEKQYDLVVLGAGPGGYVAAIRAAQLGMNVAVVDKESSPGGTCLRIGCIPSKALLESSQHYAVAQHELLHHGIMLKGISLDLNAMMDRKTKIVANLTQGIKSLLKRNGIDYYVGTGSFQNSATVLVKKETTMVATLSADHILIATGSCSKSLPNVKPNGDRVVTSTEALSFTSVPDHLVVIGAGAIGLELGSVWSRLGAKVTFLEFFDRIVPGLDSEIAREAQKVFEKQGMEFLLKAKVTGVDIHKAHCTVNLEDSTPVQCDRVLVAVGREPNTIGLKLEDVGVELDGHGRVIIDKKFQTNIEGIYAIGDVVAGPMLAHKAEEEGIALAEHLSNQLGNVDYNTIPNVVYTQPELASVGATEDQLVEDGIEYRKGTFPFKANGRAHAIGAVSGFVKVLSDGKTDRILGIHIMAPQAGELINEAASAMAFGASSEDLGRCCHAHPTLSEALREAALAVSHRAIHF